MSGSPKGAVTAGDVTGQITSGLGSVVTQGAMVAGAPINPCVEVMFSGLALRDFFFEFILIPRNEKEAETVKEIIRTIRFHAAPELSRSGFTLIPPAEFDITFYHRGVENLSIPRINTCVLVNCEVDYQSGAGGIWQTYMDGNPLATTLRLSFQEVEIVHKLRVLQNF
jgi:hypothetical protein